MLWGMHGQPPSVHQAREAEWQLLLFGTWLHRAAYASGTITNYIGAVKKWHEHAVGLSATALGLVFHRLPVLLRVVRKLNPAKLREKAPWEFDYSLAVLRGWQSVAGGILSFELSPRNAGKEYVLAVVWEVIKFAFEQLLRLAEVVTTKPASVAMRNPLKWIDVVFVDCTGSELQYDAAGRPVGVPVKALVREPPSKTRSGGGSLVLPFPPGWQNDAQCLAAGPGLYRFQRKFPVPRANAATVPLFGLAQFQRGSVAVAPLSQQAFTTAMHAICRGASPVIQYKHLGLHAYRVGGTNRLIDLGASAPQVCAAGRWQGDCWVLYARRQRSVIEQWTVRMSSRWK